MPLVISNASGYAVECHTRDELSVVVRLVALVRRLCNHFNVRIALGDDKLPAWPGDDVEFICQKLVTMKVATNISEFLRALGVRDRDDALQPTRAYFRIRAAFHAALARGRVRKMGIKWGLVPKASIVETAPTRAGRAVLAAVDGEMRGRR